MAAIDQLAQTKGRAVFAEEAARVEAQRVTRAYEFHRFTLPAPVTKVSIRTVVDHATDCSCGRAAGPFAVVPRPGRITLTNNGDNVILLYLDSTTNDPIPVDPGKEYGWADMQFTDCFLTNAGVGVLVDVGWR